MPAIPLIRRRVVLADDAFAEVIVWRVPKPVQPAPHMFKYRLAYVVAGNVCFAMTTNGGKGDHRHVGGSESPYAFTTPEQLMADFEAEVTRWNHEHGRT